MFRRIGRKDFIKLTITAVTASTSAIVGCGDDDDGNQGAAGSNAGGAGGEAGHGQAGGGKSGGGTPNTSGNANGGSGGAASSGTSGNGTSGSGASGGGGEDGGGEDGGSTAGGTAGGGGEPSGGAAGDGGHAGEDGTSGAGGSAGDSQVNDGKCEPAALTETPVTHNHLPPSFTFFANFVNGSTSTSPFRLETLGQGPTAHWHDLQLTSQEVETLRRGGTVTAKVSTRATSVVGGVESAGHTHTYSIRCA